jgi:hypothetical protein
LFKHAQVVMAEKVSDVHFANDARCHDNNNNVWPAMCRLA